MNILQTMDVYLSFGIKATLKFLCRTCIIFLGATFLGATLVNIFEYGNFLSDLSNVEIYFFAVLAGLLYRHYQYGKLFQVSKWKMLIKPFYGLGALAIITLIAFGLWSLIFGFASIEGNSQMAEQLIQTSKTQLPYDMAFILLAIYLSTPSDVTKFKSLSRHHQQPDSEPDVSATTSQI